MFDYKDLKSYKGFGIQKAWWTDEVGNRIKGKNPLYLVSDDDDYVGEEFKTLDDAKRFIDSIA